MRLQSLLFDQKMTMSHLKGTLSFKIMISVDCNTSLNILPVIALSLPLFSWWRVVAYKDPSWRCWLGQQCQPASPLSHAHWTWRKGRWEWIRYWCSSIWTRRFFKSVSSLVLCLSISQSRGGILAYPSCWSVKSGIYCWYLGLYWIKPSQLGQNTSSWITSGLLQWASRCDRGRVRVGCTAIGSSNHITFFHLRHSTTNETAL